MDKKVERSNKDKILRRVSKPLADIGFQRTKPTIYVRWQSPIVEFIHIHKFSFDPSFRIHACLRVVNDPRDWVALLGFDSDLYGRPNSPNGKKYNFSFHKKDETVDRCARNIMEYVDEVALSWFMKWGDKEMLLSSEDSPLPPEDKEALRLVIKGNENHEHVARTRKLFKIA